MIDYREEGYSALKIDEGEDGASTFSLIKRIEKGGRIW